MTLLRDIHAFFSSPASAAAELVTFALMAIAAAELIALAGGFAK